MAAAHRVQARRWLGGLVPRLHLLWLHLLRLHLLRLQLLRPRFLRLHLLLQLHLLWHYY